MTIPEAKFLDVRDAAAFLGLNEQTVRRLSRDAEVPAFKVGGVWRYQREQITRWAEARAGQPQGPARKTILVIDDEPDFAMLIKGMLDPVRYEVCAAPDGASGLDMFATRRPDLIFLDLVMPGMLGPEVLRKIRARDPRIPVTILTAYPESELMEQTLLYSPITLLSKPFRREQLLRTIELTLGQPSPADLYAAAS